MVSTVIILNVETTLLEWVTGGYYQANHVIQLIAIKLEFNIGEIENMPLIQLKKVNKAIAKHYAYHDALDELNGAELKEFYNILERRSSFDSNKT